MYSSVDICTLINDHFFKNSFQNETGTTSFNPEYGILGATSFVYNNEVNKVQIFRTRVPHDATNRAGSINIFRRDGLTMTKGSYAFNMLLGFEVNTEETHGGFDWLILAVTDETETISLPGGGTYEKYKYDDSIINSPENCLQNYYQLILFVNNNPIQATDIIYNNETDGFSEIKSVHTLDYSQLFDTDLHKDFEHRLKSSFMINASSLRRLRFYWINEFQESLEINTNGNHINIRILY